MSFGSNSTEFCNEYVRVLCDYQYVYKGQSISMCKGELFLLIRKATEDWWQVIRKGEKRSFFAPRQYLELAESDSDVMKHSLRKKIAHQRHLQNQQRLHEETRKLQSPSPHDGSPGNNVSNSSLSSSESDQIQSLPQLEAPQEEPTSNPLLVPAFQHSSVNTIDNTSYIPGENNNTIREISCDADHAEWSTNDRIMPVKSVSNDTSIVIVNPLNCNIEIPSRKEVVSPNSIFVTKSSPEKVISSSIGKLSLSRELDYSSSHTSKSSLNDPSQGESSDSLTAFPSGPALVSKAASFEVFQPTDRCITPLDICYQKAASSEELDNKKRVKEIEFQSNRLSQRNRSNSVDLKRFDNNLDLSDCEKQVSLDKGRKYRISKDPMNRRRSWALNESSSLFHFSTKNPTSGAKYSDIPPKLPPKQKIKSNLLSRSNDNLSKLEEPIDLKLKSPKQKQPLEATLSVSQLKKEFETQSDHRSITKPNDLIPSTKDVPSALPRKILPAINVESAKAQLENEKEFNFLDKEDSDASLTRQFDPHDFIDEAPLKKEPLDGKSRFREASKKVLLLSKSKEVRLAEMKENRIDKLILEIENKEKAQDDQCKSKPIQTLPPSPTESQIRQLFDGWGEYLEKDTNRLYFYNERTHEKRWKPPRKSLQNTGLNVSKAKLVTPPSVDHLGFSDHSRQKALTPPALSSALPPFVPHRERSFTYTNSSPNPPRASHSFESTFFSSVNPKPYVKNAKASSTLPVSYQQASLGMGKMSNTLPPVIPPDHEQKPISPTRSTRSIFSSITSSLSFMKTVGSHSASQTAGLTTNKAYPLAISASASCLPQVPPGSSKPSKINEQGSCPSSPQPTLLEKDSDAVSVKSLLVDLEIPKGWIRKFDAFSQQIYFQSLVTGEKWNPAIDNSRKVYFYPTDGGNSGWTLPEHSALPDTALNESSSHHLTSVLKPCKEDYLTWSLFTREGKKLRKNWSNSFISYCPKSSPKGNCGALWFSKSSEEPKKCLFEMVPPCIVDGNVLKRSTKPNVICIQNGAATELLLQLKDPDELADWMKAFITNDNALERDFTPDKEKKAKRGDKALTKKDSEEFGSPNDKGIQSFFKSYLKRRPSRDVLVKKGIYKEAVFGSTIAELCSKEGPFIPLFVLKCFQNIEKNRDNFKVDGLYRICGNASRIQKIRFEVAQNRYSILEEEKDVHNLTGALKLFFRELKEPVVPFVCYHTFIRASENSRLRGRSEALQEALKLLPRCNHDTLKLLLEHLLKVNMCEQDNRMSIMNLAVVFGPCLLWPEDTIGLDLMTDVMLQNRVIEALLSDYSKIYKDSKLVLP